MSVFLLVKCCRHIQGSPESSNLTSPLEKHGLITGNSRNSYQGYKRLTQRYCLITVHIFTEDSEEYFPDTSGEYYWDRCPKRHEVWYDRLPKCGFICENMDKSCVAENDFVISGCECKFRYARPSIGKPCQPVYNCPSKSPESLKNCY